MVLVGFLCKTWFVCVHVYVCACMRVCVHACVRACVRYIDMFSCFLHIDPDLLYT